MGEGDARVATASCDGEDGPSSAVPQARPGKHAVIGLAATRVLRVSVGLKQNPVSGQSAR